MTLRTIVYVDAFNLYYGALRRSPYKWLDLRALASRLLHPGCNIEAIKYFTAPITAWPDDPDKPNRQRIYLRALRTVGVEIVPGHFLTHNVRMHLANPVPGSSPSVEVVKTEEKGSDVNIASHMLLDAARDRYDCALLVSGDSDLTTPVQMAIGDFGKRVGVFNPQHHDCKTLRKAATFYRLVRAGSLAASQFPPTLTDAQGSFSKPAGW